MVVDNMTRRLGGVLFTLGLAAFAGCSAQVPASEHPAGTFSSPNISETLIAPHVERASWYGPGFQGRQTSTGERFDQNALTAASTTLPLGSHVRVTNPKTGRSVVVRINDRGPYVRGRSIDLSRAAAERIGVRQAGVAPVEVASPTATPSAAESYQPSLASAAPAYPHWSASNTSYSSARSTLHRGYRRRYASSSRHHTVSNPVGSWVSSMVPTF